MNYFDNGDPKILFAHLPKTGGRTILHYLDQLFVDSKNNMKAKLSGHRAPKDYIKHTKVDDTFIIITGARNPWDWHVSYYNFNKMISILQHYDECTTLSFEQYLNKVNNNELTLIHDTHDEWNTLNMWWYKYNDIFIVDHVIKTETLYSDMKELCEQYSLNPFPYIHINKSKRDVDYKLYYNDTTKKIVHNMHEEYVDFFKYRF